ncbi:hypothetical protein C0584_04730 [Candidatus Parcubacteria bacterium]|nr:MAG: hypothetical protein C0584_04730 [Candidatus Parcubacteria bacterium]
MLHLFKKADYGEICFNILTSIELTAKELLRLRTILGTCFDPETISGMSYFNDFSKKVLEVGPRLNFATAFHSNVINILHRCGLTKVLRIEWSKRYFIEPKVDLNQLFITQETPDKRPSRKQLL